MITRIKKSTEHELTHEEWTGWHKAFFNGWRVKHEGIDYFGVYYAEDDNFIDQVFCGVGANGVPMSAVVRLDTRAEHKKWLLYIVKRRES